MYLGEAREQSYVPFTLILKYNTSECLPFTSIEVPVILPNEIYLFALQLRIPSQTHLYSLVCCHLECI